MKSLWPLKDESSTSLRELLEKIDLDSIDVTKLPLYQYIHAVGIDYDTNAALSESAYCWLKDEWIPTQDVETDNERTLVGIGASRTLMGDSHKLTIAGEETIVKAAVEALKEKGLYGKEWKDFNNYEDRYKSLRARRIVEHAKTIFLEGKDNTPSRFDRHYGTRYKLLYDGKLEENKPKDNSDNAES